eukprot:365623-Chlamydomonas_euryale.AAC.6
MADGRSSHARAKTQSCFVDQILTVAHCKGNTNVQQMHVYTCQNISKNRPSTTIWGAQCASIDAFTKQERVARQHSGAAAALRDWSRRRPCDHEPISICVALPKRAARELQTAYQLQGQPAWLIVLLQQTLQQRMNASRQPALLPRAARASASTSHERGVQSDARRSTARADVRQQ